MINKIQALLVIIFLLATPTYGTNYYVDKDATGSNNGTNWSNAWISFGNINWSAIQPGDNIYVSGGTYSGTFTFGKNGTSGSLITVSGSYEAGHNDEVVISSSGSTGIDLSGRSYIRVNHLSINDCGTGVLISTGNTIYVDSIKVSNASGRMLYASGNTGGSWSSNLFIRWCDLETTASGQADGIYIQWYWQNIEIRRNRIVLTNTGTAHMDGIQWSNYVKDIIVANNWIQNNTPPTANRDSQGMMLASLMGYAKIYGNVIYCPFFDGKSPCIYTTDYQTSEGTYYIYNNTFIANFSYDIIRVEDPDAWIKNNIFYNQADPTTGVLWMPYGSNDYTRIDGNLYGPHSGPGNAIAYPVYTNKTMAQFNAMGSETYGTPGNRNRVDPLFDDLANGVFSLQAGSPAIDAGIDLGPEFNSSINGVTRPQGSAWDIGAYEMVTGGGGGNNPPNQPVNPNPVNGAIDQSITLTLSWSCTDPNGDPLTYDVYFGTTNNPPLASGNQTGTSYNPGQLNNNTTYYWKIVAKDNQGATTAGPVWNFTTVTGGGGDVTPPEVVSAALLDSVTLRIIFTEPLEQNSAQNINNYSITNNIDVLNSSLSDSEVTLTTTEHLPNVFYTVTVNNVTDLAGNIISPTANTASYQYIAAYELTELQIDSAYAEAWYQNYNPPKAIDGITEPVDPESRWGGALPMPDSIMFDLGQDKMVGQTRFSFYEWNGGRIYTYSVYSSIDGNSWSAVAENISSSSTEWSVLNFNLIECRYIKLVSLTNNQSQWAGLYEAEIWGQDQATAVNTLEEIPTDFKLEQNYPNPFNPTTTIRFNIPFSQHVKINVYNVIGELVKELVNDEYSSGSYSVEFNAADLPSGIYLYRLESQSFNYTRKMILVK